MKKAAMLLTIALLTCLTSEAAGPSIDRGRLRDQIRGGWAGKTIGCTFGAPVEFVYQGTFVPDYQPILWNGSRLPWSFKNDPGAYDDVYMNLTFVEILDKDGLDAPASSLGLAFARARFPLWHANQAARSNILAGLLPPKSGQWRNNPHADDIDFQIEADFAGLMSPGMPEAASRLCDRVGHIMNYGDGWYGGVFVAALYTQAFVARDIPSAVDEALKVIPAESVFAKVMRDVILWHKDYPLDWKETWFRVQRKWGEDIGCPEGVFSPFEIDAKINCAWVLLGLLYGQGDFGRTLSISARAGDDADCNPATAGGILGTWLGYSRIPDFWKQGLAQVERQPFQYTTVSLADATELSLKHALEMIRRQGGRVETNRVILPEAPVRPLPLEVSFPGHYPVERRKLNLTLADRVSLEFEGIGFALNGEAVKKGREERVVEVAVMIDGQRVETVRLPTAFLLRRPTLVWAYELKNTKHRLEVQVLNPSPQAEIRLDDIVVYGNKPLHPAY